MFLYKHFLLLFTSLSIIIEGRKGHSQKLLDNKDQEV